MEGYRKTMPFLESKYLKHLCECKCPEHTEEKVNKKDQWDDMPFCEICDKYIMPSDFNECPYCEKLRNLGV